MIKILRKIFNPLQMSPKEYEASITALNIFFGAVIGISLGNIGESSTSDYVTILIVTSSAVMAILFVAYSEKKLKNTVMAASMLGVIWWVTHSSGTKLVLPPKVLPTLCVWLAMVVFTELWKIAQPSK